MIVSSCFGVFFPPQNLIHFRLDDMLGKLESELGMERVPGQVKRISDCKETSTVLSKTAPIRARMQHSQQLLFRMWLRNRQPVSKQLQSNLDWLHSPSDSLVKVWVSLQLGTRLNWLSTGCQLVAILFLFLCQSKVAEHLCQLNCYSLATMSLFVEEFLKFLFFMLFADLSQ